MVEHVAEVWETRNMYNVWVGIPFGNQSLGDQGMVMQIVLKLIMI
jgi:hypothetical protein